MKMRGRAVQGHTPQAHACVAHHSLLGRPHHAAGVGRPKAVSLAPLCTSLHCRLQPCPAAPIHVAVPRLPVPRSFVGAKSANADTAARQKQPDHSGKSELDIVKDKIVSLEEKTAKLERLLIDNPERQRLAGLEQRLAALDLRLAALQVKENLLLKAEQGRAGPSQGPVFPHAVNDAAGTRGAADVPDHLKTVATSEAADPRLNLYVNVENPDAAVQDLLGGQWAMIMGHRQCGKSTLALSMVRAIKARGEQFLPVYAVLNVLAGEPDAASVFLGWLLQLMGVQDYEVQPDKALEIELRRPGPSIVLLLDEGDVLDTLPAEQLSKILLRLRDFKRLPEGRLLGVALLGTERLLDTVGQNPLYSFSPFNAAVLLRPLRFEHKHIVSLLQQLAAKRPNGGSYLHPSVEAWAIDIFELTEGVRGLVGVCLYWLEALWQHCGPISREYWGAYASAQLPALLANGLNAYRRMIQGLGDLKEGSNAMAAMEEVLLTGRCRIAGGRLPADIQPLVWSGVLRRADHKASFGSTELVPNSPLLLSAMLVAARISAEDLPTLDTAPEEKTHRSLCGWLLCQALRVLAWPKLLRREVQRKDGQPLEYVVSSAVGMAVQLVLNQQPWASEYFVLPEVRQVAQAEELDGDDAEPMLDASSGIGIGGSVSGRGRALSPDSSRSTTALDSSSGLAASSSAGGISRKRLDWLLANGSLPRLGLEFMVRARPGAVAEHCNRARLYAARHDCTVLAVNFSMLPQSKSAAGSSSSSGGSNNRPGTPEELLYKHNAYFRQFPVQDLDQVVGVNVLLDLDYRRAIIHYPETAEVVEVQLMHSPKMKLSLDPRRLDELPFPNTATMQSE